MSVAAARLVPSGDLLHAASLCEVVPLTLDIR